MDEKEAYVNDCTDAIKAASIAKRARHDIETFMSIMKVFIENPDETSKLFTHEQDELMRVMFGYYLNNHLKPKLDASSQVMRDFALKYDIHE